MQKIKRLKQAELRERMEAVKLGIPEKGESMDKLIRLTELSLTDLQAKIKDKAITPLELLHAFQMKAMQLYEKGNSGICEFIQEAKQQASQLTENPPAEKSELFGVPISIKELCCVRGYDATFGLWKYCKQPSEEDCVVVQVLKRAGAVPFVLTATSQLAFTTSGFNPVFGDMKNPYSDKHEPGGSSNGEAVLLAQNGSPVGIGSDIAGSIRIPCIFCGLTGLKPTTGRISTVGSKVMAPQTTVAIKICIGPMGKRVDDLAKVMRTLLSPSMYELDPTLPVLPFNETMYSGTDKRNLVIGYYDTIDDPDIIQTVPSVRRVVRQAVRVLSERGHRLVQFSPPKPLWALELGIRSCGADGGQALADALKDEQLNEVSKSIKQIVTVPYTLTSIADALLRKFIGKPAAICKLASRFRKATDLMSHLQHWEKYGREFAKAWKETGDLDALICPGWAYPAQNIETPPHFITPSVIYTLLFNVVDYPAGAVPMGKVTVEDLDQAKEAAEQFKQSGDAYHEQLMLMQADTNGLPLGVQVVAKPFREELVLRIMSELEAGGLRPHDIQ
ncbi:hypothetical protein CRM22_004723 [Opisthorchis felineus]|uniref:Amidase domain-containing protein n=1 Tax=Opisthorchis felineus TaxID=147828 RepID=A0A4S2M065_OPIFE|nr:hypothetical protein CRM22_004723 [Opisthorchis felineus]